MIPLQFNINLSPNIINTILGDFGDQTQRLNVAVLVVVFKSEGCGFGPNPAINMSIGAFPLQHVARFKLFFAFPLGVVPAQGYFFTFFLAF